MKFVQSFKEQGHVFQGRMFLEYMDMLWRTGTFEKYKDTLVSGEDHNTVVHFVLTFLLKERASPVTLNHILDWLSESTGLPREQIVKKRDELARSLSLS